MDSNWPYVAVGYTLAAGSLGGYVTWLVRKLRRAERSLPPVQEPPR